MYGQFIRLSWKKVSLEEPKGAHLHRVASVIMLSFALHPVSVM